MTNEQLEIAPESFDKAFLDKREYWRCIGHTPRHWWKLWAKPSSHGWTILNYTKEDAETTAPLRMGAGWVWDGEEATRTSLSSAMLRARQDGRLGVRIKSFLDGKWVTVKEYRADEPLPVECRDL